MIVVGLCCFLLSGCAMSDQPAADPKIEITRAKSSAQAAERAAADLILARSRTDVEQVPAGVLVSCAAGKQWSGNTKVHLASGATISTVFREVLAGAPASEFTFEEQRSSEGNPRLQLDDHKGNTLYLSPRAGGRRVDIDSFSKCFAVPSDFQDLGTY